MPHGHCFLWKPSILWPTLMADALIAIAYFSIPISIAILIRRRKDIGFKGVYILFASFIWLCGLTHLMSIFNLWNGSYGLHAIVKLLTAGVSICTAIVVYRSLPQLLQLPSISAHNSALENVEKERALRIKLEEKRKTDAIFKDSLELLPSGCLVIDQNQIIRVANREIERILGYEYMELEGMALNKLLTEENRLQHPELVTHFMKNPSQNYAMASGRLVCAQRKNGEKILIEISLSVHTYGDEQLAYASVVDVRGKEIEYSENTMSINRVRRAMAATNDGVWEWNIKTNEVWFSDRLLEIIGSDSNDYSENFDSWRNHIHPDYIERANSELKRHFKSRKMCDFIYLGLTENGKYQWMRLRGKSIFDSNGKAFLMSGVLSNIDEIKDLESKYREQTLFLNEILDKSLCGMYIFDLDKNRNSFINTQYTEITGYTLEDLNALESKGNGFQTLIHLQDRPIVEHHIRKVMQDPSKQGLPLEYRFKHKDGHWIWCYSRDSIYSRSSSGRALQILGTFFEITGLKKREEQIKVLAKDFYTIFEQAAVGIALVSLDGHWKKANAKFCQIVEYDRDEIIDMNVKDLAYKIDTSGESSLIDLFNTETNSYYSAEKRLTTKSGNIIWTNFTISLVNDDDGNPSHFISVIEDISLRKKTEFQLEESNKALERFAYSASHDLQEPLRKISTFSDSLKEHLVGKLDDPDTRFELKKIIDSSNRMRDMIDSLLQLSRYSTKQINLERLTLSSLINEVLEDLSEPVMVNNLNVELLQDIEISVDKSCFLVVFRNLFSNSMKYKKMNEAPNVIIEISVEAKTVVIQVKDNGMGFDNAYTKEIFEPFRRLVGASIPGHGMGLALCKQIIKAHKGTMHASSFSNGGAIFTITIPLN